MLILGTLSIDRSNISAGLVDELGDESAPYTDVRGDAYGEAVGVRFRGRTCGLKFCVSVVSGVLMGGGF